MLKIPDILQKRILASETLNSSISKLIFSNYVTILEKSHQPLFPEYTDHTLAHNQALLEYGCQLITPQSIAELNDNEIIVLVYSIILHDLAMHITFDGLRTLIESNIKHPVENQTWNELWEEYSEEWISLPSDCYKRLFRSGKNGNSLTDLKDDITQNEILICGEFLRRHHAALAFCIVQHGFPLASGTFAKESYPGLETISRLSGIVAMSHGYSLADMDIILKKEYGESRYKKPYGGVRVYFLMGILRIADYLHAGSDRAPLIINDMNQWGSKISQQEWNWNKVVCPDFTWNIETESLDINTTEIQSSSVFHKVRHWLHSLQDELDITWAVCMEKYNKNANRLEFSIRRISSPILDFSKEYEKKFYATPVKIKSDTNELQQLFASSLYGNNPNIAVRELIQNAVDACLHRKVFNEIGYRPEIHVDISRNKQLIVSDNGIGMTVDDIVTKLFQTGGPRKKNLYENGVQILQSGEFGIGFLSVFMLGNEIELWTRKYNEDTGVRAIIRGMNSIVDLETCECPVGTKLQIQLHMTPEEMGLITTWESADDDLPHIINVYPYMEYYILDDPKVIYSDDGSEIPRNLYYDSEDDDWYGYPDYFRETEISISSWNKLPNCDVFWRFSKSPRFYLNGFKINYPKLENHNVEVVFFDEKHVSKLSLDRSSVDKFPYHDELFAAVAQTVANELIASPFIFRHCKDAHDWVVYTESLQVNKHNAIQSNSNLSWAIDDILIMKHGFGLITDQFKNVRLDKKIFLFFVEAHQMNSDYSFLAEIQKTDQTGIIVHYLYNMVDDDTISYILQNSDRVLLPVDVEKDSYIEFSQDKTEKLLLDSNHPELDMDILFRHKHQIKYIAEFSEYSKLKQVTSVFDEYPRTPLRYIDYNKILYIPYNMVQRQQKFPECFTEESCQYTATSSFCINTIRSRLDADLYDGVFIRKHAGPI